MNYNTGGYIMNVLVSGGTGYIGSHTVVELLKKGHDVVVFDNLYNSKIDTLDKIKKITGKEVKFYQADMLHPEELEPIFQENKIDCVIHFAGLKAVGESVAKPLMYYENNLSGTINLVKMMAKYKRATTYLAQAPRWSYHLKSKCMAG